MYSTGDHDTYILQQKNVCNIFYMLSQVAVAQYATENHAVFNFENFAAATNPVDLMNDVTHEKGNTYTAAAIRFVL